MSIDRVVSNVASASAAPAEGRRRAEGTPQLNVVEPAQPAKPPEVRVEKIEEIAKQLDSFMKSSSRALEFRVDDKSGRTVVSVRDGNTGDLIRQYPSEEVVHLAQMAQDQQVVLVNEKA